MRLRRGHRRPPRFAGRKVKCPKCAQPVQLSAAEAEIDFAVPPDPGPAPSALPSSPRAGEPRAALPRARTLPPPPPAPLNDGWRTYGRWGLAAALLPLVFSVFMANDNPIERLAHMVDRDPALAKAIETVENKGGELDDLLRVLPDHRIEGSLHSRDTKAHWLYAALSAGAFWGLILLLYPLGRASSKEIWAAGLFVGTVGILLLLGLQYVASWTQGTWIRGRSIIVIIFYIVKFIGFSYRAALDPTNNFFLSMLGFTFGVGLCEELCKALPLLWHFKKTSGRRADTLDVRGAVVWGLAAGIGFGVSEGITYSGDSYNGVSSGGIYVVRFVSCVALHAVWSATNALFLWKRQAEIDAVDAWYEWFVPLLIVLGSSMVLHGLYDTLLKREHEVWALVTAAASFALFFWLYDRSVREETPAAPAAA